MPVGVNADNIERQNSWALPDKTNSPEILYEATKYGTNDQLTNTQVDSSPIEELAQEIDEFGNCKNGTDNNQERSTKEVKQKNSFEGGVTYHSTQKEQLTTARKSPGELTQSLLTQDRRVLNDHFPYQLRKDFLEGRVHLL